VMLDELDGPITALQHEDLKTINQNGRFLLHLINELLDLARIEAGKLELNFESVDLRALISDIVETVQGLVRNKDVILRVSLPSRLPPIRGDTDKIRQILLNLLSNAVKFTERGSITIMAQGALFTDDPADTTPALMPNVTEADEAPTNGHNGPYIIRDGRRFQPFVAISVRDTGIGIAQKNLDLIFEEFRQVHAGRTGKRGSGLGLAITRKLIEAHDGKIWVESTPGQGSTFTFTLPISGASAEPHEQAVGVPVETNGRHSIGEPIPDK
jgi:two-component system, sensor histidine kinase and response regulator